MRRLIAFACDEQQLVGSLDTGERGTALLIVSGGDEIRCGAHRGMAMLADAVAEQGFPVFRFDRRGIGDSGGRNGGWSESADDIAAAVAALRTEYPEARLVGMGNCDAATALAFFAGELCDAFILTNPHAEDSEDDLPPASAIRARYAEKLKDPKAVGRALSGGISFGRLRKGLGAILASAATTNELADQLAAALVEAGRPLTIILAMGDATAIAFEAAWAGAAFAPLRERAKVVRVDTHSHSFAKPEDGEALTAAVLAALERADARG